MAIRTRLPIRRDIEIPQGGYWQIPSIVFPDFTPFGGPVDLTGCTVIAQIRPDLKAIDVTNINIEYIDRQTRTIRPYLTRQQTESGALEGYWDLFIQEDDGPWGMPWFEGTVTLNKRVSR